MKKSFWCSKTTFLHSTLVVKRLYLMSTLAKVLEVYTREEQMYMLARLDIKAMFHSKAKKNEY